MLVRSQIDLTTVWGARTEMVLDTIGRFHGDFAAGELQEQCPNVEIDLIRRILRKERERGRSKCLGRGGAGPLEEGIGTVCT